MIFRVAALLVALLINGGILVIGSTLVTRFGARGG